MKKIIIILMSILSITACSTVKNTPTGAVEEYLSKYQNLNKDVVKELKRIHRNNMVPIVMLSISVHQMVHNNTLEVYLANISSTFPLAHLQCLHKDDLDFYLISFDNHMVDKNLRPTHQYEYQNHL